MSITSYLAPDAILLNLNARNSEEVIRALGSVLLEKGLVKDDFIAATLKRESEMPTGLPLGCEINAAIPHVDIEYVNHSALALATLTEPVVFYHMVENDVEVPCRLVIMLALDAPKSQIEMLQEISEVLQNPAVIASIIEAKTPSDVLAAVSSMEPT